MTRVQKKTLEAMLADDDATRGMDRDPENPSGFLLDEEREAIEAAIGKKKAAPRRGLN